MSGKKVIVAVLGLLLLCCCVLVAGLFLLPLMVPDFADQFGIDSNFSFNVGDTGVTVDNEDNTKPTVGDKERKYSHPTLGFSLILPESWVVDDEADTEGEITTDSSIGSINFEVFDDPSFLLIDELDQEFCDSFGEGFRTGLGVDDTTADQFKFDLFELNGNTGCRAEGSLFTGINQRYYVFFNAEKRTVYSIFYTATGPEEGALRKVIDSFDFE